MDCTVFNERQTEPKCFAIMLYPAPKFPDDKPWKDLEDGVHPYAVHAAHDDTGAWAWVFLSQAEKELIGQKLVDHCVEVGKWYWCILYRD
jgi:hypothetical protein